jgi:preprotein translocase SecE subunit
MAFGIFKRGQGNWSRGVAALALSAMGIWGAISTHEWCARWFVESSYAQWWVPAVILVGFLWFAYFLTNRPKTAEFLIETQTEMKKVTWPTSREVISATVVVIVVVLLLGAFLFLQDRYVISPVFRALEVLPGDWRWYELVLPVLEAVVIAYMILTGLRTRRA